MPIGQGNCRHLVRFPRFKNNILEIDSTRPSYMPKTNNQPLKKFLSLAVSCQNWQNSDFQSQFSMPKIIRIFRNLFFIEEYDFR